MDICENCGQQFIPGQSSDMTQGCMNCGHPMRSQPNPTVDDMRVRNMPDHGQDMGGNPLKEGILGDYQNRKVRDESFAASTKTAMPPNNSCGDCGNDVGNGMSGFKTNPDGTTSLQCMQCWAKEHPQGLPPHPGLGFEISPQDHGPQLNDPRWSHNITYMNHSDQTIHMPWEYQAAAAEIPAEIDKIAPPGISNEYAEEIMEEDDKKKKKSNIFGDVGGAIGDAAKGVGNYAIHHPWQTGLMAGGALLTGGLGAGALAGIDAGVGSIALDAGAGAAGAAGASAAEDVGAQAAAKAAPSLMSRVLGLGKGGLKSGIPVGMGQGVGREIDQHMGIGGNEGVGGGGAQPSMNLPVRGLSQLGAAGDDKETPTSHGEIPSDDTSDPEKVDPHEKNDDSGEGYFGENDVNDIGGTTAIHPDSAGAKAFMALLPLVLHHAQEGTGGEDPIMQALHQMLDKEFPGYLDTANDGHMHELVTVLHGGSEHGQPHSPDHSSDREAKTGAPLDAQPINGPQVTPGVGMMGQRPGVLGHCPTCGATTDPTQQVCPQCGAQIAGAPGHGLYSAFEMPRDFMYEGDPTIPPEMSMGDYRHTPHDIHPLSPCPNCGDMVRPMNDPTQQGQPICPHCLQPTAPGAGMSPRQASGPQNPEQILAVQELLKQQGRKQEVPNVVDHPEQYARELAMIQQQDAPPQDGLNNNPPEPPQIEAPPGATMPVPGMGSQQQMVSAINKWSADSIAPACPNCGSHTTGLVSNDGDSRCHTCGHSWPSGAEPNDGDSTDHVHTAEVIPHPSSVRWKTATGEQLKEGKHYYMHTKGVEIPDVVKVDRVKPDELEITYEGEHGLSFRSSIDPKQADLYQYTFTPYPGGASEYAPDYEPDPNQGENDDNSGYAGEVEQSDMSNTHQFMTAYEPAPHEDPNLDWLMDGRTAGAKFTPMEQREFIDEQGVARNSDKMDLSNTHYESSRELDEDDFLFL